MIRILLALVIVALGLLFVLRGLQQVPVREQAEGTRTGPAEAVREAEQVKTLLEAQQRNLERRVERERE